MSYYCCKDCGGDYKMYKPNGYDIAENHNNSQCASCYTFDQIKQIKSGLDVADGSGGMLQDALNNLKDQVKTNSLHRYLATLEFSRQRRIDLSTSRIGGGGA